MASPFSAVAKDLQHKLTHIQAEARITFASTKKFQNLLNFFFFFKDILKYPKKIYGLGKTRIEALQKKFTLLSTTIIFFFLKKYKIK